MSIMDLKVFKMINEDLNLKEIEEDILFSEINKNISSSILSIIDLDSNVLLSVGL